MPFLKYSLFLHTQRSHSSLIFTTQYHILESYTTAILSFLSFKIWFYIVLNSVEKWSHFYSSFLFDIFFIFLSLLPIVFFFFFHSLILIFFFQFTSSVFSFKLYFVQSVYFSRPINYLAHLIVNSFTNRNLAELIIALENESTMSQCTASKLLLNLLKVATKSASHHPFVFQTSKYISGNVAQHTLCLRAVGWS